jgi:ubiquinone biosynthesis protein
VRLLLALDDGVDVHVSAADLEPLVARLERLGNRIAMSVLTAAAVNGAAELAAAGRLHQGGMRRPSIAARVAAVVVLAGYISRRRVAAKRRAPVREP